MLSDSETQVEEPNSAIEQHQSGQDPISTPMQNHESALEESLEDLHWPIALRKGKRNCTRYPIARNTH